MVQLIFCISIIVFTGAWLYVALHDNDFKVGENRIKLLPADVVGIVTYINLSMVILRNLPIYAAVFAIMSLPYLIVAAWTDKKTKLVYDSPFYFFASGTIILSSIANSQLTFEGLVIYIFAQILASLKLYGRGDRGMTVVCGSIYYICYNDIVNALLMTCIMILIAEIILYAQSIKEKNLDGPFKLKESRPLGPKLCLATYIVLLGEFIFL